MIDAPPERVWAVLTDFDAFGEWNPFIRKIAGEPSVGSQLEIDLEAPGGKQMTFRPQVVAVEVNRELRWLGRVLMPRIAKLWRSRNSGGELQFARTVHAALWSY